MRSWKGLKATSHCHSKRLPAIATINRISTDIEDSTVYEANASEGSQIPHSSTVCENDYAITLGQRGNGEPLPCSAPDFTKMAHNAGSRGSKEPSPQMSAGYIIAKCAMETTAGRLTKFSSMFRSTADRLTLRLMTFILYLLTNALPWMRFPMYLADKAETPFLQQPGSFEFQAKGVPTCHIKWGVLHAGNGIDIFCKHIRGTPWRNGCQCHIKKQRVVLGSRISGDKGVRGYGWNCWRQSRDSASTTGWTVATNLFLPRL